MKKVFVLVWVLFAVYPSNFIFSLDKAKVFDQLQKKYFSSSALKITFSQVNSNYKGILIFQQPNKFHLELKKGNDIESIIISNGSNMWNYSIRHKRVIISKVVSEDELSLQTFFTYLPSKFKPISLSKEINSLLGSSMVLKVQQVGNESQSVKIFLNKKIDIKAVEFDDGSNVFLYSISKIKSLDKFSKDFFEFKPPKGVEIFDYR